MSCYSPVDKIYSVHYNIISTTNSCLQFEISNSNSKTAFEFIKK